MAGGNSTFSRLSRQQLRAGELGARHADLLQRRSGRAFAIGYLRPDKKLEEA